MSAVLVTLFAADPSAFARQSDFGLRVSYSALYESNIYHSFADSNQSKAMVNELAVKASWRKRQSRLLLHRVYLSLDYDQYVRNSNRNQGSLEFAYEPKIRYARHGQIALSADVGRRQKDLIDDSGQSLTRTLTRWEADLSLTHRYDLGRWRFDQSAGYRDLNYDERDTVVVSDASTSRDRLMSYDYHAVTAGLLASVAITTRLEARLTFDTESRHYAERRTYTVKYGATIGRPYAIRSFHENDVGLRVSYVFFRDSEIRFDVDYAKRTDNFENYYGYEHRQYKATLRLQWGARSATDISFRFKNKDYPNYHTRNIGTLNRVHIDYADFQIEYEHLLLRNVTLNAYMRNYNKVSNDPSFDYHDLTAGTGFTISY